MKNIRHVERVRQELKQVGVTSYGLLKSESKYLPTLIHEDEHIGGAINGKTDEGSVMLIATDHRIIFLDRKLFFTTMDELTYDVVSGVKLNHAGIFTSVTLHTRVNDYSLRYVNINCANNFVRYIEERRLEKGTYDQASGRHTTEPSPSPAFQHIVDPEALNFLKDHDLAVLSTVDRSGNVNGAVVYYLVDQNNFIYIMTKSETTKARGLLAHGQVSLTIHEPGTLKTAQISGMAEIETNQQIKDEVFTYFVRPRTDSGETHLPPVIKLKQGSFMIVRISPTNIHYTDYSKLQ